MIKSYIVVSLLLLIAATGLSQNLLNGPESVVYDLENNRYLVSNYYDGAIIELNSDGVQSYFYTGLPNSRGMTIKDNILFVVHDNGVSGISLSSGTIVYDMPMSDGQFINDIAFDSSGNFYISDYVSIAEGGGIYKANYASQTFVKLVDLDNINGITYDYVNDRLLGCGGYPTYRIFEINPDNGVVINQVPTSFASHDGLVLDLVGNVYVSSWHTESVYRFNSNLTGTPVIVASGLSGPADIFYNRYKHTMIIPNLNSNSLDTVAIKADQFVAVTEGDIVTDNGISWCINWVDYDNDNYDDIFVTNIDTDNALYHNNGDGTFTRQTASVANNLSGIATFGSTWADYDNDGYIDAYNTNFKENTPRINRLFKNNGDGTFAEISAGWPSSDAGFSIDPAWADYDNDGLLDLYVANHEAVNYLYHQTSTGFEKINVPPVSVDNSGSNGAGWFDFDNDGDKDLVVLNGWGNYLDYLYENNGNGTFTRITTGAFATATHLSWGASPADYDNDLDLDLFVTNSVWNSLSTSQDYLFENDGTGLFSNVTGIAPVTTTATSFGSAWGDYDNDGDLDLVVAAYGSNLIYENLGVGTFDLIEESIIYTDARDSEGMAWADYDRDGDLDLYVTNSGSNSLYQNTGNLNNWINIKCVGTNSNRSAIGAKVLLKANINGVSIWQMREISSKTGKNGQNSLNVHFGLGDAELIDSLVIKWPSGVVDTRTDIVPNQFITITESICGDFDNNGLINILDITGLISFLYKGGPAPESSRAADPDGNNTINILDITYLIGFLYKSGGNPICF
ncbi:MAG: FG-GAP-like repeat-containing protein [Candidatus Zixiibacteriota bacterium]